MTGDQRLTLTLSIFAIFIIPLMALTIRAVVKWTRVEAKLETIAQNMEKLVKDKDAVHAEIITTMREDRRATDRRLRWLEEHIWKGKP